jgi:hypothetical protein
MWLCAAGAIAALNIIASTRRGRIDGVEHHMGALGWEIGEAPAAVLFTPRTAGISTDHTPQRGGTVHVSGNTPISSTAACGFRRCAKALNGFVESVRQISGMVRLKLFQAHLHRGVGRRPRRASDDFDGQTLMPSLVGASTRPRSAAFEWGSSFGVSIAASSKTTSGKLYGRALEKRRLSRQEAIAIDTALRRFSSTGDRIPLSSAVRTRMCTASWNACWSSVWETRGNGSIRGVRGMNRSRWTSVCIFVAEFPCFNGLPLK